MLRHLRLAAAIVPFVLILNGCSDEPGGTSPTEDSGSDGHAAADGSSHADGSVADSGQSVDSGHVTDATAADTSVPPTDASIPDTSVPDTSVPDTSVPDTGVHDSGTADAADGAVADSGHDAGTVDSGHDAGTVDSGQDTGAVDSGTDSGIVDAGVDTSVPDATVATYSIGGTLSGLAAGATVVLQDNGGDSLNLTANGGFAFGTKLASGASFNVTVSSQPGTPVQTCAVTSGSGTVAGANVTSVAVTCTTSAFSVGGSVTGLTGGAVVTLQNNAGETVNVGANGTFTFPTPVASGSAYAVTVSTQAALETCTVSAGNGTIGSAAVGSVSVACAETYPGSLSYYFGFDGDALDHSGNGHDGQVHNATLDTDRFGNANSAYNFTDGAWIQADGSSLPIGGSDRTITAWLRPNSDNDSWGVVYWGNNDCYANMFGLGAQSGSYTTFWGGCMDAVSGYYMAPGAWGFAAIRYVSATNTIRITFNGATTDYTGFSPNTQASNLWIGGETTTNDPNNFRNYFDGAIDSVRIFNRALTDDELNAVYTTMP